MQSALEYGITAYGRADKTKKIKLQSVQNSLLKIIFKKEKLYSTKDLYKHVQVLNLPHLTTKNICSFIHKYKDSLIKEKVCPYELRKKSIKTEKYKTTKGQKTIDYYGIKLYADLPTEIKELHDHKKFKEELKGWLKKQLG